VGERKRGTRNGQFGEMVENKPSFCLGFRGRKLKGIIGSVSVQKDKIGRIGGTPLAGRSPITIKKLHVPETSRNVGGAVHGSEGKKVHTPPRGEGIQKDLIVMGAKK